MTATVLVLGATGNVGRFLVKDLLAQGASVKAASRKGDTVETAPGVAFDYTDGAAVSAALEGVSALYLMAPTGTVDPVITLGPVVDAAIAKGIKIVFQSVLGVDADDSIPYRQIELTIERSGVPFVILRPNWFSDNFHNFWKAGIDAGVIAVPAGEGRSSFIDARDIAASAAAALTSDRFDGRAFNLTGPEALSYADAAAIIAPVVGHAVRYDAIDDDAFVALLTGAGMGEDYARFMASIFYPVRQDWTAGVTGDVEALTGHRPITLAQYANDYAAGLKA